MFEQLLRNLFEPTPEKGPCLAEGDARLALAALLIRVARADGDYAQQEIDRIDRIIMARYALSPIEAARLRSDGETLETEAPDTVRFTRALKSAVALEERIAIIEALWHVVLADDVRDPEEDSLLRMVSNLLGISDQDSARARQRAGQSPR